MQVLELYSGIGGMHMALIESGIKGEIKAAIDINTVANTIYKHNFPTVNHFSKNIKGLTTKFIEKLDVDTILMSPPCQPFTRNGLQRDTEDDRTSSFKHILDLLPTLPSIKRILIENVKGFETSEMRNILIDALNRTGFGFQEFILSPTQLGVPNTRHRYYCLAKKADFSFDTGPLMASLPGVKDLSGSCSQIGDILETDKDFSAYYLKEKVLSKHAKILDICHNTSKNSCCFTKSYSRYTEGTGSIYTNETPNSVRDIYEKCDRLNEADDVLCWYSKLGLRYFTPREVCRLMSFPESFDFPSGTTDKQKYMVLGNSINVKVVSELIKLLK